VSRKTGAEYARLTLEDFHGTAEAIVFPETWKKLASDIFPDSALLLSGGYSPRDRGEDRAPFIVEEATALMDLRQNGAMGIALTWETGNAPDPAVAKGIAALCASYPGPATVTVQWSDGNCTIARMQARQLHVELKEELLVALRELVGVERVTLVRVR
jgi:DNA polymerase-3 subunit alpha